MTGAGWNERVFTFYSPEGAEALRAALERFDGGRLVVNLVDMPIKCPVAPLEFAFLADWYLRERGVRGQHGARLRDPARRRLHQADRLARARRPARQKRRSSSSRSSVPARSTGSAASSSPTTNASSTSTFSSPFHCTEGPPTSSVRRGSVTPSASSRPTRRTLQTSAKPNVFALGDATDLPTSKAGSVTHFEAEVLADNIARFLAGERARAALRRPRELLHRDRVSQGPADRLQLRRSSRCPATSRPPSGCRSCGSLASTTSASSPSSGSTGTRCCPGRDMPGIGPTMPTAGKKTAPVHAN